MAQERTQVSTERAGGEVAGRQPTRGMPLYAPPADIKETKNGIVVELDMPSADAESIDVSYERRKLRAHARGRRSSPGGHALVYGEYRDGDYEREFAVSDLIDSNKIDASYTNGVLTLTLPFAKQAQAKKIRVKSD